MRKQLIIPLLIVIFLILSIGAIGSFALFRGGTQAAGSIATAEWSVTRNQSASGDSLEIMRQVTTDTYTLSVRNDSEVDVKYNVIIDNLPDGVKVSLDGGSYQTEVNNSITFTNVGRINYNAATKTRNHTLTFSAEPNAEIVSNQEIDIDVVFIQVV